MTTPMRCVDERWDNDGRIPYDGLADFLAMCDHCHGERPHLREQPDGTHLDDNGLVVLEPVE